MASSPSPASDEHELHQTNTVSTTVSVPEESQQPDPQQQQHQGADVTPPTGQALGSESRTTTPRTARGRRRARRHVAPATGKARGVKARIRRFSPAWFSVTMGCGIPSVLLFVMPWQPTHAAFRGIGTAFLIFDMFLFGLFASIFIVRYILYPQIFPATLRHEVHSLFLGTLPMGYITIITAIASYGDSFNLPGSVMTASVLFWTSVVVSLFSVLVVPWMMVTKHEHRVEGLTAAWLLPYVPPLTIAACGSNLSNLMLYTHPSYALDILIASYINLGIGLFTACSILVLYLQRLTLHKLPPKEVVVSTFLPLGPCGQAGYAAVQLGRVSHYLFPVLAERRSDSQAWQELVSVGPALYGAGVFLGLLLFAFGLWWAWFAFSAVGLHLYKSITKAEKHRTNFSLGWWATTFPVGSMNLLIYALARTFDNTFLRILGTIVTALVCLCWLLVIVPTVNGFMRGTLFEAPCLSSVAKQQEQEQLAEAKEASPQTAEPV